MQHIAITDPEIVQALEVTAKQAGKDPEAFATDLLKTVLLARRPFEEIVEPLALSFEESGMTEEEFDRFVERERQAIWDEKHGKK